MNAHGVVVLGLDMQGHGHSEGERALAMTHEHLVSDVCQFVHHIYEDDLGSDDCRMTLADDDLEREMILSLRTLPFFLMGSSMGGAISVLSSLQLCKKPHFVGCTLLAPYLGHAKLPHWLIVEFFKYTFGVWTPNWHMPPFLTNVTDDTLTWTDENDILLAEMDAWGNEGGLGFGHNMKWGTANMFLAMGPLIVDALKDITFPFLILHDPGDEICNIEGSRNMLLMSSTPEKDKTLIEVDGYLHGLIYNRPKEVCDFVVEWVQERVPIDVTIE